MRKIILISILLIVVVGFSIPTKNDKILYIFPDDVEIEINDYIESQSVEKKDRFMLTLHKEHDRTYKVYVNQCESAHSANIPDWGKATNRFAVINNKEYPLIFDYDYDFGTKNPTEIGEYGNRDGRVLRIMLINDGFYIRFNKAGIIK